MSVHATISIGSPTAAAQLRVLDVSDTTSDQVTVAGTGFLLSFTGTAARLWAAVTLRRLADDIERLP